VQGRDQPAEGCSEREDPVVESFEALFDRYEQKIFNLIYRLVGDQEEAADLTSDTFVRALRSFGHFRGEAQAYTWLYRIAVNLCKNHFRQKKHRAQVHAYSLDTPTDDSARPSQELEDWRQEPTAHVESKELHARVQECIDALPEDLRLVVVLRDVQGLSYQEIANIVGASVEAVKSRLFRARTALRDALQPYLGPAA